jgi:hypothetical protein
MTRGFVRATSLLTALLVGGCASVSRIVQQQRATRVEATLAAAGFHIEPADTADRLARLHTMTPFELIAQRREGKEVYAYADPVKCRCQWVGDPQQYADYERLRHEDLIAAEDRQALAFNQGVERDLGSRGALANPWWWWQ